MELAGINPESAWKPLSKFDWNDRAAMHFLRRSGFSSSPAAVDRALGDGLEKTVHSAVAGGQPMPQPASFEAMTAEVRDLRKRARESDDPDERRKLNGQVRRREDEAFNDLTVEWLRHARRRQNSAQEKFVLFLQDVFVVARQKVRNPAQLYDHQALLRDSIGGSYPGLCKAMSRNRAMMRYLDLDRSSRKKPNENFARELFELFTLGEGNYSESDIKEAARAFAGYRLNARNEFFIPDWAADKGEKTVFGQTGNWSGDEVIDIVFEQPASRTFLANEMAKFYLGTPLPEDYAAALGDQWADNGFHVGWLAETFFSSRLFYHPDFRGNLIKSPVHFYLGLCQDLSIDVVPFPRHLRPAFRGMGQDLFNPPNVRGWLYGPHWINSSTVTARRGVVRYMFEPVGEKRLNGDEEKALSEAAERGLANVTVPPERMEKLLENRQLENHIVHFLFAEGSPPEFRRTATEALREAQRTGSTEDLAACMTALLQSPAYNLS